MSREVYKVCVLDSRGVISKIILFCGETNSSVTAEQKKEWVGFSNAKIQIVCVPFWICPDDTITTIKYKIVNSLRTEEEICYEELYLYGIKERSFDVLKWYKQISENDTKVITKAIMNQALANMSNDLFETKELEKIVESELYNKSTFTFEDIQKLFPKIDKIVQKIPLGVRFNMTLSAKAKRVLNVDELFPANPFDILPETSFQSILDHKTPILLEEEFLFHYGNVSMKPFLFVCLVEDVHVFIKKEQPLQYKEIMNFYFPHLRDKIKNEKLETFFWEENDKTHKLMLEKSTNALKETSFQSMDMFYGVHYEKSMPEISYLQQGIESFHIRVLEDDLFRYKMKFPLEAIFKNIHTTSLYPYVEYIPGDRQLHMVRLFEEELAQNGKPIPYLLSSTLLDIVKERTIRDPHIVIYMYKNEDEKPREKLFLKDFFQIILEKNGNIQIKGTLEDVMMIPAFETWLKSKCKPIFDSINETLMQSGYQLQGFNSVWDSTIEVLELNYKCTFPPMSFQIEDFSRKECFSSLFVDEKSKEAEERLWRYIRVEHYKKMDKNDEFITKLLIEKTSTQAMMEQLRIHFNDDNVEERLSKYTEKYRVIHGRFLHKEHETLANAGFPVKVTLPKRGGVNTFFVEHITAFEYLLLIPMYIDSIIRVVQKPLNEKWLSICSTKDKKLQFVEKSPLEKSTLEKSPQEVVFLQEAEKEDEDDDFLNFYLEDDEDKDEKEDGDKDGHGDGDGDKDDEDDDFLMLYGDDQEGGVHDKQHIGTYLVNRLMLNPENDKEQIAAIKEKCQPNDRLPILMESDNDKKKMKEEGYPILEMGKNKKTKKSFFYGCPEYWCTEPGKEGVITEAEVESGYCKSIIKNPQKMKDSEFLFHNNNDKNVPNFIKDTCLPCCFGTKNKTAVKTFNEPALKFQRQKCNPEAYPSEINPKEFLAKNKEYILEYNEKVKNEPLPKERMGKLPKALQLFFELKDVPNLNKAIAEKPNYLFRYGVESTKNQSFLACISDLYDYELNQVPNPVPNQLKLSDFRNMLITAVTLDMFIQLQNGSLPTIFSTSKKEIKNYDKYKESTLFKNLFLTDESQRSFLDYSINSYEQFQAYLLSPDTLIDHQFLWEIVAQPNPLFKKGLNLIILEMIHNDITNKIRVVCPSAQHNIPLVSDNRPTAFLYKEGTNYEPIYYFEHKKDKLLLIKKTFSKTNNADLSPVERGVNKILRFLLENTNKYCTLENVTTAQTTVDILKQLQYTVEYRIMNFRGKIVAFEVSKDSKNYFLPCYPSTSAEINKKYKFKWINDPSIYHTFEDTIEFLNIISTNKKLEHCKPTFQVVENGMVIGVLTLQKQFIKLNPPVQNIAGLVPHLTTINGTDHILADTFLNIPTKEIDKSVFETNVSYIILENQFYNSFRNTIRTILRSNKKQTLLLKEVTDAKKMEKKLKEIGKEQIVFQEYDLAVLKSLQQIQSCQTKCDKKYCSITKGKGQANCQLIVPKYHLVSKLSNEKLYYERLADEFVRNRFTQQFLFYPEQIHSFPTEYSTHSQEFILPKPMITQQYFDGLIPFPNKTYARTSTFDTNRSRTNKLIAKVKK